MVDTRQHYIECYRHMIRESGLQEGSVNAVGGYFDQTGKCEVDLLKEYGLRPDHFLVDVGCGCGRLASALGDYLAASGRYLGLDILQEPLTMAAEVAHSSCEFGIVDEFKIDLPDCCVDFVTFFSVLTHIHCYEGYRYLVEARRILKPGGKIILSYIDWECETFWETFENNARYGPSATHVFVQPMNEGQLTVWARHLQLRADFLGLHPLGQHVVVLTKGID